MKACRWNLIYFSKFTNALIKKRKNTHTPVNEKRKTEKGWILLFYKTLYYGS